VLVVAVCSHVSLLFPFSLLCPVLISSETLFCGKIGFYRFKNSFSCHLYPLIKRIYVGTKCSGNVVQ
jgi:hypothetical protein